MMGLGEGRVTWSFIVGLERFSIVWNLEGCRMSWCGEGRKIL